MPKSNVMNTVKLIEFITSSAFWWSLLIIAAFLIVFKIWTDKAERKSSGKYIEPPYINMNDPEVLDELLEFRRKPLPKI